MQLGPTIIKKCSVCSKMIEQPTLLSGNTFGARYWTDGKMEAPMLPDQPWLVLCPFCRAPLWIDEIEELGQIDIYGHKKVSDKVLQKFKDAIKFETPSFDDFAELLKKKVRSKRKERYIRLQLWWAGNDARRTRDKKITISAIEESNMTGLAAMLSEEDENDLVMKAELMRELGRFADARSFLSKSVNLEMSSAVKIIESLIEKEDRFVKEMIFEK